MRRSRILIPASILLVVACGGGGSGSIDPPSKPASYTLTTSNTAAVSFDQSTVTVNEGAPATVTGTLNAGWENLRVAVSNGMTGALTQIGSKFTFVVSNVRSAGVVTAEATAVVPTYTLTTKSLVAGLHFNQSSADIKRGSNVTFTGYVDDGWANVRVAATNSLGGTLTVNGANFTYTIANAQSGGEVQGTADFIIPPAPKGKVVTVASQKVLTDMRPLLEQHLGAIAAEFDVETQIMACPSTPAELRKWLTDNRTGLKHVFLVGQVPVVRRTIKMLDILPSTETQTTDHYYTGIDFTYQEPVLQSDGSHMVPGVLGQYSYQQISLNYLNP